MPTSKDKPSRWGKKDCVQKGVKPTCAEIERGVFYTSLLDATEVFEWKAIRDQW